MATTTLKVRVALTQQQIRDKAMRREGIEPAKLALKRTGIVQDSERDKQRRGHAKHKHRDVLGE